MPSAFFTGLSGLRSHSRAVEVIANNLANINTISFKGSRSDFRDLFYQQIGQSRAGVASQVGIGVAPITVSRRFEQGTIQNTSGLLDAAIQGEGFFIVKDIDLIQYTRAGNFQLNQNQQLVTLNGEIVQGWIRDASSQVDTNLPITDITLQGNDIIDPAATQSVRISANLSSSATTPFSRPIQIFDSLGESHILTLTFSPLATPRGTASKSFDVTVSLPRTDVVDPATGPPAVPPAGDPNIVESAAGVGGAFPLDFDAQGSLINPNGAGNPYTVTLSMDSATQIVPGNPPTFNALPVDFANNAARLNVTWDLLDSLGQGTLTAVAAGSAVTDLFQDGTPSAELTSISIADAGKINGLYSDGRTLLLAQLALQRFTNPQTLLAAGNNNFVPTSASGVSTPGEANTGGLGSVVGLSLEFSNVDIAQEFTNLLTFQRGFQANSRVITTADELNQEALNLKR